MTLCMRERKKKKVFLGKLPQMFVDATRAGRSVGRSLLLLEFEGTEEKKRKKLFRQKRSVTVSPNLCMAPTISLSKGRTRDSGSNERALRFALYRFSLCGCQRGPDDLTFRRSLAACPCSCPLIPALRRPVRRRIRSVRVCSARQPEFLVALLSPFSLAEGPREVWRAVQESTRADGPL